MQVKIAVMQHLRNTATVYLEAFFTPYFEIGVQVYMHMNLERNVHMRTLHDSNDTGSTYPMYLYL